MGTPSGKVHKVANLAGMMLPLALLLIAGLSEVETSVTRAPSGWTYNVECYHCEVKTPSIVQKRRYVNIILRCMTVSIRVSPHEILVYKDCTWNCTFVYTALVPLETPRSPGTGKTNSFYFTNCCNGMHCNVGGPTNMERDLIDDTVLENDLLDGTECWMTSAFFPIFASIIASNTQT
ncbi:LOW QUALITY PROTEIN: glycosyl-phosphatidylinositol-anchored molecule-like protein [Heterocephalus glaber]|uniref:LOW QUALITY PROTEIN: glycosyl-phosphatidylinositol-anchored molecule-like protein n=1 Tax=Heterocephalus glaber TaxID=10181 RepID=A0AAX6NVG2_HETGA|nr:LOW QUALITY PROTEIN: glycosyl-phosphatidylinositol-anchored molecule-like protein [Heterocephalus glaber]